MIQDIIEKLIVTKLFKKYPFLWNPKFQYRVHKSPSLDRNLSQPNSVRPIDPYLPKVHFNVILPPTPRSSQWFLPFWPNTYIHTYIHTYHTLYYLPILFTDKLSFTMSIDVKVIKSRRMRWVGNVSYRR
jgi:hypothetical protein